MRCELQVNRSICCIFFLPNSFFNLLLLRIKKTAANDSKHIGFFPLLDFFLCVFFFFFYYGCIFSSSTLLDFFFLLSLIPTAFLASNPRKFASSLNPRIVYCPSCSSSFAFKTHWKNQGMSVSWCFWFLFFVFFFFLRNGYNN